MSRVRLGAKLHRGHPNQTRKRPNVSQLVTHDIANALRYSFRPPLGGGFTPLPMTIKIKKISEFP